MWKPCSFNVNICLEITTKTLKKHPSMGISKLHTKVLCGYYSDQAPFSKSFFSTCICKNLNCTICRTYTIDFFKNTLNALRFILSAARRYSEKKMFWEVLKNFQKTSKTVCNFHKDTGLKPVILQKSYPSQTFLRKFCNNIRISFRAKLMKGCKSLFLFN